MATGAIRLRGDWILERRAWAPICFLFDFFDFFSFLCSLALRLRLFSCLFP
jgi:hypothetical protein